MQITISILKRIMIKSGYHSKMLDKEARKLNSISNQVFVLCGIFCSFLLSAIYRFVLDGKNVPVYVIVLTSVLTLIGFILGIKNVNRIIKGYKKENLLLVALFFFVVIARIPLFNYIQRYDAGTYWGAIYEAAKNFEFSPAYIWNGFRLWGHTSIMFTFFSIIGEFITLGNSIGYCIVNTIMSAFAVVCIYKICVKKLRIDKVMALLLCITLQCVPLFWGTFSHVNPDYMILIFFIYMWYTHLFEMYYLCFFWMLCLIQTKETGIVIVFGYTVFYLVHLILIQKGTIKSRIIGVFMNPFAIISIINAIFLLASFLIQGDVVTWKLTDEENHSWFVEQNEIQKRGTDVNAFGIYPKYIICKIIHMFSLNFSWVATVILLFCIIYMLRRHLINRVDWSIYLPTVGAFVSYALFNMLYITYALYRYNVFSVVMLWLITLTLLSKVINNKKWFAFCNIVLLFVLVTQTFTNADILSNRMFNKYSTGNGYLIATDMKKPMYGDNIVNNYKYTYIDDLLDEMLKTIDYSEDIIVVYDDDDSINRVDLIGMEAVTGWRLLAGWNKKTLKREAFDDTKKGIIPIKTITYSEMIKDSTEDDYKYILYFFDFSKLMSDDERSDLLDNYEIELEDTVFNWRGNLHYVLARKKQ